MTSRVVVASESHRFPGSAVPTAPTTESPQGPSANATVMVDVGRGAGALVVWTPPTMAGVEIEIRRVGADWDGTHSAVRRRDLPGGPQWAVLFGSLADGQYELRVCPPVRSVAVVPGQHPHQDDPSADMPGGRFERGPAVTCRATIAGAVTEIWWPAPTVAADSTEPAQSESVGAGLDAEAADSVVGSVSGG